MESKDSTCSCHGSPYPNRCISSVNRWCNVCNSVLMPYLPRRALGQEMEEYAMVLGERKKWNVGCEKPQLFLVPLCGVTGECFLPTMTSRNVSEVKSFLGLCLYYWRSFFFIWSCSPTFVPALWKRTDLLMVHSCTIIMQKMTEAPFMTYLTPGIPFMLDTDASNCTTGAVFSEIQGEEN